MVNVDILNSIIEMQYCVIKDLLDAADEYEKLGVSSVKLRSAVAEMVTIADKAELYKEYIINDVSKDIIDSEVSKLSSNVKQILDLIDNGVQRELIRSSKVKSSDRTGKNNHFYKFIDEFEIKMMMEANVSVSEMAKHFGVSIPTMYSRIKKLIGDN